MNAFLPAKLRMLQFPHIPPQSNTNSRTDLSFCNGGYDFWCQQVEASKRLFCAAGSTQPDTFWGWERGEGRGEDGSGVAFCGHFGGIAGRLEFIVDSGVEAGDMGKMEFLRSYTLCEGFGSRSRRFHRGTSIDSELVRKLW